MYDNGGATSPASDRDSQPRGAAVAARAGYAACFSSIGSADVVWLEIREVQPPSACVHVLCAAVETFHAHG